MRTTPFRLMVPEAHAASVSRWQPLPDGWVSEPLANDAAVEDLPGDCTLLLDPVTATARLDEPVSSAWTVVLVYQHAGDVPVSLMDHPRILGAIAAGADRPAAYGVLRGAHRQLVQRRAAGALADVLEVGRALSGERDLDALFGLILHHGRRITGADGASIYTLDRGGSLYFRLWQNASTARRAEAQKTLVGDYSIAGYVARTGSAVNIEDAYALPASAPYRFNPASDRSIGYHTQSLLTLPMLDKTGKVVGVLQLINKKIRVDARLTDARSCRTYVVPFTAEDLRAAEALAGHAGVALENSMLHEEIEALFEGFIKASVTAIEARDPVTAGHSFRVAEYTERLARAVDRCDAPGLRNARFGREQLREIRYAALLHDFGKVGVREQVLVKAEKLYPHQLNDIRHRLRFTRLSLRCQLYRKLVALYESGDADPAAARIALEAAARVDEARLDRCLALILDANAPAVDRSEAAQLLGELAEATFPGENGEPVRLLTDFEFADLALSRGSLNDEQRREIESHVSHTYAFLRLIPWTRSLAALPEIAYAHHEKLDGSGYPRGLHGDDIPLPARIMTIADIFDALTAGDRPYKRGVPSQQALDMLAAEVRAGKIDADLYRVFVDSRAYRDPGGAEARTPV